MRALANSILAAFFLVLLISIGFSYSVLWFGKTTVYKAILFRPVYTMQNALEAAKYGYVKPALRYSFYQACFDNMKKGGWNTVGSDKKITYEDNDYFLLAGKEEFLSALKDETKKNLRVYTGKNYNFILDEEVMLPDYDKIEISQWISEDNIPMINVSINATNQYFQITKEIEEQSETIRLYLLPDMNETFQHNCFYVYNRAVQENETVSAVLGEFEEYLGEWPTHHEYKKESDSEIKVTDCIDETFYDMIMNNDPAIVSGAEFSKDTAMEDAVNIIKTKINIPDSVQEIQDGDFRIVSEALKKDVRITYECPGSSVTTQNGKTIADITCDFTYTVDIMVKINITGTNPGYTYPVYNGTNVSFEPVSIEFVLRKTITHGPETSSEENTEES
jgi:hypothetical protein